MKLNRGKRIPIKRRAGAKAAAEAETEEVREAAAGIEAALQHEGSAGCVDEAIEIEKFKRGLSDSVEREKRLTKDFQNYRRHAEASLAGAGQAAREELLSALGEILRDLEQAIAGTERDADSVREGIALVVENIERLLSENGLQRIATVNAVFDPSIHEAVATEQVAGVAPGMVVRELSPGFRTEERVVQPARVSVAG